MSPSRNMITVFSKAGRLHCLPALFVRNVLLAEAAIHFRKIVFEIITFRKFSISKAAIMSKIQTI